jgi:hypothetical protein
MDRGRKPCLSDLHDHLRQIELPFELIGLSPINAYFQKNPRKGLRIPALRSPGQVAWDQWRWRYFTQTTELSSRRHCRGSCSFGWQKDLLPFLTHSAVIVLAYCGVSILTTTKGAEYFLATRLLAVPLMLLATILLFHFIEPRFAKGLEAAAAFWPRSLSRTGPNGWLALMSR